MPRIPRNDLDRLIGQRIRVRRQALGISLEVLAARLGISYQQLQKYEHGQNKIAASTLAEIADQLQMPIGYFYGGHCFKACKAETCALNG